MTSATFLLLHGFTGAATSWDPIGAALGHAARVIAPDLAGHRGTGADTWEAELDRLAAMLEHEPPRSVHLVGYSMGGRLGWGLIERALPSIARATLIGAHPGLDSHEARVERRRSDARWVTLLHERGLERFVESWEALPLWNSQRDLPAEAQAWRRAIRMAHDPRQLANALSSLGLAEMPSLDPARVSTPVTLVAGERDSRHRALGRSLLERLPRGRMRVVDAVGHDVAFEAPEALTRILLEAA